MPKKGRLAVLLIFNILFFEWADPFAGIWLLSSVCLTWGCALLVEKGADRTKRRLLIGACLSFQLILLAVFKYLPVWNEIINKTYGRGLQIVHLDVAAKFGLVAPIGISFYTLEAIGYLIDVSRGKYPAEKSFWRFAAFLSFFPNIMSGPIERGDHFLGQLREITEKKRRELLNYDRVMQGLIAMLLGYGMKLIVAQRAEILVNQVYSMYQDANSFTMLMAAFFYAVQIYCDFASYSMIAVGVGRLFGFELVQNFKQPYFAKNLMDFWRRWHISLSSWLRDYIYSAGRQQKGTCSQTAQYTACFSHQRSVAWRRAAVFGMGTAAWCRTGRAGFLQKGEASGIRGSKNWPGKAAAYAFGSADLFYGDVFLDIFPQRIGIDGSDLSEKYVYQVERISVLETVFVHDGIGKNAVFHCSCWDCSAVWN